MGLESHVSGWQTASENVNKRSWERQGGVPNRRIEVDKSECGKRMENLVNERGQRVIACTCIDTDIYARQLIMSKSFDLSLAFMEGN